MPVSKLRPSFTFTEDRLAELRSVVPEAFADGKINWDVLRDALGEHLEDDSAGAEHFGLFWPGKREARRLAALPSKGALIPMPGEGVNEDTTRNIFIEGDNLEVLKLLQKSYAGRVKMIYIDPPYNTGNDFVYLDDYKDPLNEYLLRTGQASERGELLTTNPSGSGRYHSNWLSMIYPRLLLARQLLRDDGLIFVSIDDHEVHNLRALLNEVFGEENFVATIIWQKMYAPKSSARHFSEDHDYVIAVARSGGIWTPELLPRTDKQNSVYKNPDNDPRGLWRPNNLAARNYYSKGTYSIRCPSGRVVAGPPKGSYWRVSEEKFWDMDRQGRIWWGEDGNNVPAPKIYLSEVKQGRVPQTLWSYTEVGHSQEAKKELISLMDFDESADVFSTPKPVRLVKRMLQIATEAKSENIVLDFFAGSCTTAQAVLDQNNDDGGDRRFIMVQLPEQTTDPRYPTISEIGKERLRRAIKSIKAKSGSKLSAKPDLDLGFKPYRLDHSSFVAWQDYSGDDAQQLELLFESATSPLVVDWESRKVLIEIQLLEGFSLDSQVTQLEGHKKNEVLLIESDACAHRLFVCLDKKIKDDTLQTLKMDPDDIFVCLDSALTDEAKVRLGDLGNLRVI